MSNDQFRVFDISRTATTAMVVVLAFALTACDRGPEPPTEEFPPDPDLPEPVVDLPDPPPESAFEIQEHNDDGSLRIEGVIGNRDQYMGEEVEIRGTVTDIIGDDCDPNHPAVDTCPRLHLLIQDHADDDLDLIVVGFEDNFLRTARIREGEEYHFEGVYTDMAHDFVSTEEGLIDLHAVGDHEVEEDG